jgi:hypothetical protein
MLKTGKFYQNQQPTLRPFVLKSFLGRETPTGEPVAYGGKPSCSTGLTSCRTFRCATKRVPLRLKKLRTYAMPVLSVVETVMTSN